MNLVTVALLLENLCFTLYCVDMEAGGFSRSPWQKKRGSATSIRSMSKGEGNHNITGRVKLRVWYQESKLFVHMGEAKELIAGGYPNSYIKVYLLPQEVKQKTEPMKGRDPVYQQVLQVLML